MPAESTQESQARRWERARRRDIQGQKKGSGVLTFQRNQGREAKVCGPEVKSLGMGKKKSGPRQKTGVGACNEVEGRDSRR